MSQSFILTLLMLAFVLPVLSAILLRLLVARLSPQQLYGAAALVFGLAFVSVLVLARSNISSLQVGGLSLLLPVAVPVEQDLPLPPLTIVPAPDELPPDDLARTSIPTASPTGTSTPTATSLPTTEPPTAVPPTAVPPTEIPPTPAPTGPRTYVVQPGDTLRGIAEQFDVSVEALIEANNLTPEEADALRIGQELVIP